MLPVFTYVTSMSPVYVTYCMSPILYVTYVYVTYVTSMSPVYVTYPLCHLCLCHLCHLYVTYVS